MSACSPIPSCGNMHSNILCVKTRWLHESPGLVIIYFIRLPNHTLPFVFSGETVRLCMGESENPNLRLRSCLELWSRSWHGWFLEQSFLVRNLFYNDTFVDVLLRGWNGDRKSSRCLPNTSTFVPNDRSQCLLCLAHHAVRLWRSPRRWPRGATNPVQIRWKSHVSFPLSWGRWPSLIRRNRYNESKVHVTPFAALTCPEFV